MSKSSDCGCRTAAPLPAGQDAYGVSQPSDSCGCASAALLAIVTVPAQPWETPYDPCNALRRGTIFSSLDKPFFAAGGDTLGR